MSSPIYFKSLEIKNIRTFDRVNLDLQKENGILPQWTLILGDNGIGKSTLLQCIAWMKPNLSDPNSPGVKIPFTRIESLINNEENETIIGLIKKSGIENTSSSIKVRFTANRRLSSITNLREAHCEQRVNVRLSGKELQTFSTKFKTNNRDVFSKNNIVIYGYSASRKSGKLNLNNPDLEDTLPSFILENTILYDAQEILHTINYAAVDSKSVNNRYKRFLDKIKDVLVEVLPNFENVKNIYISAPKFVDNRIRQTDIKISTKHGKRIPFDNFSLGYKTVATWIIDLSWRLINQYPNSKNPLAQPAIVLIDEIDLHLHPIWQREIIQNLSNKFPNVQFIATAHSPLLVQFSSNANYVVLKMDGHKVEVLKNPEDVEGWRVDQILTSSLFNLPSSRGPEYESLLNKRKVLMSKANLTSNEKRQLNRISNQLYNFPSGRTPEEIKQRKVIADLIEKLKKKKISVND